MDELELLRRLEADAPRASQDVMADAFDALEARMAAAEVAARPPHAPRRRRGPRGTRWAVLLSAAAAVTVLWLVLSDIVGLPGLRPDARAQAAELLEQAAAQTITTADPVVRAGQYRQVVFQSVHDIDTGPNTLFSIHEDRTRWIPSDVSEVWTEVRYPATTAPGTWGSGAKAAAEAFRRQSASNTATVLHGAGGAFFGLDPTFVPRTINALPRDPTRLLTRIRHDVGNTGSSADGAALNRIAELLASGVTPAPVRAALYRAAALVPDVTLVAHAATLRGLTGVAIGRIEPANGIRLDLIVDPATGDLIGEREVATRRLDPLPAGTTLSWSSTTTTVVDELPTEYKP